MKNLVSGAGTGATFFCLYRAGAAIFCLELSCPKSGGTATLVSSTVVAVQGVVRRRARPSVT